VTGVDIHCVSLEVGAGRLAALERLLSPEEQARAARFRFLGDRRHFVACRGALREILAGVTRLDPAQLKFSYNPFGKPALMDSDVSFNVSHSNGLALYAVARSREVGVDVESIDPKFADQQIPESLFTPGEVATLRGLPVHLQTEAFFLCWARKEAYVKARGIGLSLPLSSFDVTLTPGEPAAFLRGAEGWLIESIEPAPGYAAAVVG